MSYTIQEFSFIDSDLLSGSTDDFVRQTFGGFYVVASGSLGEKLRWVPVKEDITSWHSGLRHPIIKNTFNMTSGSSVNFMKNISLPYSIMGDSSQFSNEHDWKSYIEGGSYGGHDYTTKHSNNKVFEMSPISISVPYDLLMAKYMAPDTYGTYTTFEHTYRYNYYLKKYQQTKPPSYLFLPNAYELLNYASRAMAPTRFKDEIADFLDPKGLYNAAVAGAVAATISSMEFSRGISNYVLPLEEIQDPSAVLPPTSVTAPTMYLDPIEGARKYFYNFHDNTQSSSLDSLSYIANDTETQILNSYNYGKLSPIVESYKHLLPFYNIIDLPSLAGSSPIHKILKDNKINNIVLKEIASKFSLDEENDDTQKMSCAFEYTRDVLDKDGNLAGRINTTETQLRTIDLVDLITKYSNYGETVDTKKVHFVGDQLFEIKAAQDETGAYRYYNKLNADNVLDALRSSIEGSLYFSMVGDSTHYATSTLNFPNMVKQNGGSPPQPIAHRIIKRDIETDKVTDILIEAIETASSQSFDDSYYCDSQVEYGKIYSYNVLTYYVVENIKYKYRNLHLSRPIGELDFDADGTADDMCIEFYDYSSQNGYSPSPMTADADGFLWDSNFWDRGDIRTLFGSTYRYRLPDSGTAEYSTPAQEFITGEADSTEYWADFIMDHEVTYKIVEVGHTTKTLAVLDHPPIAPDIVTYQHSDNSQKIGFYINMESYIEKPYPESMNSQEEALKLKYLASNNLLSNENIPMTTNESRSRPRYVEIYRLSQKPKSIEDFDNNIVAVKDLMIKGNTHETKLYNTKTVISPSCFYDEKITTNHKFYYAFRYLNENAIPGQWSTIQEIELVDDGGYKYLKADVIPVSALRDENEIINNYPFTQFKNIFTLLPNISNYKINDSAVDYERAATTQVTNIDFGTGNSDIWNKTFKVRLTSKKTGKKIDLNVTYKLRNA